jgi:hypothetical protein
MRRRFAGTLGLLVGFTMVVQALPAGAAQFKAQQVLPARASEKPEPGSSVPAKAEAKKTPAPAADPDWDPKDPAAVQYSDGAWGEPPRV